MSCMNVHSIKFNHYSLNIFRLQFRFLKYKKRIIVCLWTSRKKGGGRSSEGMKHGSDFMVRSIHFLGGNDSKKAKKIYKNRHIVSRFVVVVARGLN